MSQSSIQKAIFLVCASVFTLLSVGCQTVGPAQQSKLPLLTEIGDETRIDHSVRVAPGVYYAEDLDNNAAITIVANNVTLDLTGVVLVGAESSIDPDAFHGVAIRAEGVSGLRILGGTVRGYRVAIEVIGGTGHSIERCDLSGNFRQRLKSTPDAEASSDWLWPHENDDDEWSKRYGAGLHLKSVRNSSVTDVTVRAGQNGIILNRSSAITVSGCDASFLSGWGLALWRTTDSIIEKNRFDYCVRGYSHGIYARGQDSAGILVFEQSSRNTFRANSGTHSGDGFFLFAGNETLKETGEGGSNDNLVTQNDFSHAVANSIEATFSTGNRFEQNRLDGSNYGVWAGYSSLSTFRGNRIGENSIAGIAIEHGSNNVIVDNHFNDNPIGVSLWWDEDPALRVSEFAKRRSTESRDNHIVRNTFDGDVVAIELRDAENTIVGENIFTGTAQTLVREGRGSVSEPNQKWPLGSVWPPSAPINIEGAGRERIFIDEWGPYPYAGDRELRVWPSTLEGVSAGRVHLLGPGLEFSIDAIAGAIELSARSGRLPTTIQVSPRAGTTGVIPFTFVVMTEDGEVTVRGTLLALLWEVEYRGWEAVGAYDPPGDWQIVRATAPLAKESRANLDLKIGGGAPADGVPSDHFAIVATSTFTVPAGRYRVKVVSDDGVRVRLDDTIIHEDWTWHPTRTQSIEVELDSTPHRFEVEHFEIDGHATLGVTLTPILKDLR